MPESVRQRVQYLDTAGLAKLLHVSERTVKRMRAKGEGPRYITIRGVVRYAPWDVRTWHEDQAKERADRG